MKVSLKRRVEDLEDRVGKRRNTAACRELVSALRGELPRGEVERVLARTETVAEDDRWVSLLRELVEIGVEEQIEGVGDGCSSPSIPVVAKIAPGRALFKP